MIEDRLKQIQNELLKHSFIIFVLVLFFFILFPGTEEYVRLNPGISILGVLLIFSCIALLIKMLFMCVTKIDMLSVFLYYRIKIGFFFKYIVFLRDRLKGDSEFVFRIHRYLDSVIKDLSANEHMDMLVLKSRHKNMPIWDHWGRNYLLIRVEHLFKKKLWCHLHWAFGTIALFNKIILERNPRDASVKMIVSLENQLFGIYNNAGKNFLFDRFLGTSDECRTMMDLSERIHNFVLGNSKEKSITIDCEKAPLRWVSGGVFSVVRYRGRNWHAFRFRGIPPVGWNIANGGSESVDEIYSPSNIIWREFAEEFIILRGKPKGGTTTAKQEIQQKILKLITPDWANEEQEKSAIIDNAIFSERHSFLRAKHDNLIFIKDETAPIVVSPLEVANSIEIDSLKKKEKIIRRGLFVINPTELGIEVVWFAQFKLDDNDYLLDGEIWEVGPELMREPVALISDSFLEDLYVRSGGIFGIRESSHLSLDCISIESIPFSEYVLFDADIEFREGRLVHLKKTRGLDDAAVKRHQEWMNRYKKYFLDLRQGNKNISRKEHSHLAKLCPVTWKGLAQYYRYGLNKKISL